MEKGARSGKVSKTDSALIGENWHNSESFLRGDQFDSIMNYALTKRMMDFWGDESIDEKQLAEQLNSLYMRYSDVTNNMMFNLLDSHDTARFFTQINKDRNRLLCAIATLVFYREVSICTMAPTYCSKANMIPIAEERLIFRD